MDKNFIIDPLTCLCKLALLYFAPLNTKLGISNHILELQEPEVGQWWRRTNNRDSREDIYLLYQPIIKSIKWYLMSEDKESVSIDDDTRNNIKVIAQFAILGLEKLQQTYKDGNVVLTIQLYRNYLRHAVEGTFVEDDLFKVVDSDIGVADKIKSNYESNEVRQISTLFKDSNENIANNQKVETYILCVKNLLAARDKIFQTLMYEIKTKI